MRGLYGKHWFCHEKIKNTILSEVQVCMSSYPYHLYRTDMVGIIGTSYLVRDREYVLVGDLLQVQLERRYGFVQLLT